MHKNVLMCRVPNSAKIKARMAYTKNTDTFRKELGIGAQIVATDWNEIAEKAVLEKILQSKR